LDYGDTLCARESNVSERYRWVAEVRGELAKSLRKSGEREAEAFSERKQARKVCQEALRKAKDDAEKKSVQASLDLIMK
jgi:hypothetical protein